MRKSIIILVCVFLNVTIIAQDEGLKLTDLKSNIAFEMTDSISSFFERVYDKKMLHNLSKDGSGRYFKTNWKICISCYHLDFNKMETNKNPKDAFEYLTLEPNAFDLVGFQRDKPVLFFSVMSNTHPKCKEFPYNVMIIREDEAFQFLENISYIQKLAGKEKIFRVRLSKILGPIFYGYLKEGKLHLVRYQSKENGYFEPINLSSDEIMNEFKEAYEAKKDWDEGIKKIPTLNR